jgi:hypothetical protein
MYLLETVHYSVKYRNGNPRSSLIILYKEAGYKNSFVPMVKCTVNFLSEKVSALVEP